ncbi:MAG: oligosaccharide flippase family protein [Clostridia bacterium]|nr:oligosaccharide flippase family protein [Clostridia bacterium]
MKKIGQVKAGAVLSYLLMICNTVYGLLMTPYIVGCLGDAEYGVYKTVAALASTLMVLDLGLGSTVMRYVAKYKANHEEDKIPSFLGMSIMQALMMCGIIVAVSAGVFFTIRPTYAATFTEPQIQKAQLLFIVQIVNMLLHVWSSIISGVIQGSNRFAYVNSIRLLQLFARAGLVVVLLQIKADALVLVLLDTALTILFMGINFVYVRRQTPTTVCFSRLNFSLFFETGKYTVYTFLVSIAYHIGGNLDNVVIGAILGPTPVTIYSMALLIYNMFQNLSMGVSSVLLPTVSKVLAQDDEHNTNIIRLIVRVGRTQFLLLGAALVGFFCVGPDFIRLWLGKGFEDVYLITLILIIPALFELCINTCLAVLRAKNQLLFFTVVLLLAAVFNAIVTIVTVSGGSYIGAAIGTASSVVLGNLIVMNVYFKRKLKLPVLKIYLRIFSKIWVCLLISGGVLFTTSRFLHGSVWAFIANVLIFCVVYGTTLWFFGLEKTEKQHIPVLNKFVK